MHIISGQLLGILFPIFSYSHSFTLVCRGVIPVNSCWVVDIGRHAAESCRMSSRMRLGQILGQIRELF